MFAVFSCFHTTGCDVLRQGLVEHYEHNELADSFPDVATTLQIPYRTVASKFTCTLPLVLSTT